MNPPKHINTLDLLHTDTDGIYIVIQLLFKLLKPVRRKYRLSVNSLIVLNSVYLFHKYKGSLVTINGIYKYLGYYDKNRLKWYYQYLIDRDCMCLSDIIKGIQYYKITEHGLNVIDDISNTYQAILYKWYNDNGVIP